MMKLKVVDDYRKVVEVEADTIDTLKARIMESLSLEEEDLSQRLLVPDGRDIRAKLPFCTPMVNGLDLLDLKDGSIRKVYCDSSICDCRLLLGWKGPFIISFVSSALNAASLDIEVDPYVTLGELKRKINKLGGHSTKMEENLPRILYWGSNHKPLIFFGLYKYYKRMVKLRINLNYENKPDLRYMEPFQGLSIFRLEPAKPLYFGEKYDAEEEMKWLKVLDKEERLLVPLTDFLMNPEKKITLKRGYKEPAGCYYRVYQPSEKRWKKMLNIIKKRKRNPGYREPVEKED